MQKICGFHYNFTNAMSDLSVSSFTYTLLISGWSWIESCIGHVAISSGDFGILKNKRSNVVFDYKSDLRPLIQWSPSLSHFHKKIIPYLHFRWRSSITGWIILKISTSIHHALMALGIRRSAMENSDGQLRYSRTTRGCSFCCSRVNELYTSLLPTC